MDKIIEASKELSLKIKEMPEVKDIAIELGIKPLDS